MTTEGFFDNPAMTVPASYIDELARADVQAELDDLNLDMSHNVKTKTGQPCELQEISAKHDVGWRRIVRHFSPSWFSVTMGTGVVAVLLASIPYQANWLYWLSIFFFGLNTLLFALATLVTVLRYTLYPQIWGVMFRDPVNSLFLATIPMGFATLIEMWVLVCVPAWGHWAIEFAWVLWMIDSIAAAAVTSVLTFQLMSSSETISLARITAAQLLPIAATIVAAGTGSIVAETLTNPEHALGTIFTCYVMWGMSVPLALTVIVIYYQRLAVHKLPPREVIVSCFLPLGPLGFGGNALMHLGLVARKIFPITNTLDPLAGSVAYILGFFVAIILWGFGITWLVFALATIYKCKKFPFNMGWWGFTFPLGVFAASTIQIGHEMSSAFFKVIGTIMACSVIALWVVVAAGTVRGAWTGKLFYAPCLANLKKQQEELDINIDAATDGTAAAAAHPQEKTEVV